MSRLSRTSEMKGMPALVSTTFRIIRNAKLPKPRSVLPDARVSTLARVSFLTVASLITLTISSEVVLFISVGVLVPGFLPLL